MHHQAPQAGLRPLSRPISPNTPTADTPQALQAFPQPLLPLNPRPADMAQTSPGAAGFGPWTQATGDALPASRSGTGSAPASLLPAPSSSDWAQARSAPTAGSSPFKVGTHYTPFLHQPITSLAGTSAAPTLGSTPLGVPVPGPLPGVSSLHLTPIHTPASRNAMQQLPEPLQPPAGWATIAQPIGPLAMHPIPPAPPLTAAAPPQPAGSSSPFRYQEDDSGREASFLSISSQQTDRGYGPPRADDINRMGSYSGSEIVGGPQLLAGRPGNSQGLRHPSQGSENVAMYQNVAADPGWGSGSGPAPAGLEGRGVSYGNLASGQLGSQQPSHGPPKRKASGVQPGQIHTCSQ